ncbi:MAG: amino acid adenylation domain-containing protein, partial [Cyanobacteria bacterium J06641_5]
MNDFTNRITELSPEQLARLTQRLQKQSKQSAATEIPVQSREQPLPVSFAQQRLWLLHQMQPDSPLYNVAAAVRLSGPLQVEKLTQSFQALCDRHEPLRTVFTTDAVGEPQQQILSTVAVEIPLRDLQHLEPAEQAAEVNRLALATAQQPFDLGCGPLLRMTLLCLGAQSHVLLFNIHHIIADGWSLQVLVRELVALYGESTGQGRNLAAMLPPLKIQYADYAVWQRQWLQDTKLTELLDYWQQQLQAVPEFLALPTDYPRPAAQSGRGDCVAVSVPANLVRSLKALGREANATLFMTGLATYLIWLYRYTGRTDLLLGSPVANRNRVQTEGLIGVLINTLALRVRLQPQWTFRQLLQEVRRVVTAANERQDLPFERLIEALAPERSLSHAPLLQVMFGLQADPNQLFTCGELAIEPLALERRTTQFDLVLDLFESAQGLQGVFLYNCDLFAPATIERWAHHWQELLAAVVAAPETPIAQLPLLSARELQQFQHWNQTQCPYSQLCLHQVVAQHAREYPEAIALTFAGQTLTYRQLDARANRLAHQLQAAGIGPETLVGICLERSLLLPLAILAVWKAGGAYVPLDPSYPQQRLEWMLTDSQPQAILTQATLQGLMVTLGCGDKAIELDPNSADEVATAPTSSVKQANLAYIIYTSGSTGKPKGVLLTHRGLSNLSEAQQRAFACDRSSQVVQFASASFDASVWELAMAWRAGATLHLGTTEELLPGDRLQQFLQQRQITHATLPPTALAPLDSTTLPQLQTLITAGEVCSGALVAAWGQQRQFFNAYGPTETTVCATVCEASSELNQVGQIQGVEDPTIGGPIANTQTYILNDRWQRVPVGVPGELCVGGMGLARGYLNRPGQTSDRFIPDPFSDVPGARLYRTGDLARYRANGEIEFLGRIDNQVKLRGFRIELGEIEARLQEHSQIEQAVALVREDRPGDKRLVTYLITVAGAQLPAIAELRQFLSARLPDYMLPSAFVPLEHLPITPNGKIDRKALPVPSGAELTASQPYVAPETERQQAIAAQFAAVLALPPERVGLHANFFELGGHSLLATQLVSRLQQEFGLEIPLKVLFEATTVAELDRAIATLDRNQTTEQRLPTIEPLPAAERDAANLPLSFAQQRLWFLDRLEGGSAAYNIPGSFRIEGALDIEVMQRAIATLVERHESLRTCFPAQGDSAVQCVVPQLHIPLEVLAAADLDCSQTDWLIHQSQLPFDLATGPLLRVKLLQVAPTTSILSVVMHHIISDGWSSGVFIREIVALYQSYRTGQPITLTPLPIQYADYGVWQRQWLQGEVLEGQLHYWQQQLAGAPALLELPTDYPRPAVQSFQGRSQKVALPAELTAAVNTLAQQQGVTVFMVLLAAFQILLARYSTQEDIVVGSPIANRKYPEVEGLIGFFVNTLALRTTIDANTTVAELLQQIRRTALDAYAHQDVPFERVIEALSVERTLAHTPLFQVMFVLQNVPTASLELEGITLTPLELETGTAKFDLTLSLQETAEGFVGVWEYNTDLFADPTIERMARHFQNLLVAIAANPQVCVGELSLLDAAERHQLLTKWDDSTQEYPQDKCIHQLFEEQAEKNPDAVALVFADRQLTYGQLNQKANQVARYLQSLGVGPEVLVGLCVERSLETIVGLLGILKAGGAYVPIDPTYPQERLNYILADAAVTMLLTQQSVLASLPSNTARAICLDRDWELIEQHAGENLEIAVTSEGLAYVIYTSGSTGKPKGVLVEHKNVARLMAATQSWYHFNEDDIWTNFHSIAFDFSVWEIWGALLYGGRLVIVPYSISREPQSFYELLSSERVTILNQTPSAFRQLINIENSNSELSQLNLRLVIFGGEALEIKSLKPWFDRHGDRTPQLVNMYGITETTVHVTYRPLTIADLNSSGSVIGCPIPDLQMYILDESLQPVPVGVKGQMYVGGAGVARGYLNRQELTSERFIANPFDRTGDRLYKTGDLARYLPNGDIEYLGRIDNQVKVRGFRIELGEIESVLSGHPQIQQATVIVREDIPGYKRLVAYFVAAKQGLAAQQLREFLTEKLPDYMVPADLVALDTFPLTANGKVDRKALPAPDREISRDREYVAPRTPIEQTLTQIWQELLLKEKVSIHDNFFDIGGDSILSIQVVSRAKQAGIQIAPKQIFQNQTIAELASVANTTVSVKAQQGIVTGVAPLTPIQHWFFTQYGQEEPHHYNQAVL